MKHLNIMAFIACLIAMSLFSCSGDDELLGIDGTKDYKTRLAISEKEYREKVCGNAWKLISYTRADKDVNPDAVVPFYDNHHLINKTLRVFYYQTLVTCLDDEVERGQKACYNQDNITYNSANGWLTLDDGGKVMKIVEVKGERMVAVEGYKSHFGWGNHEYITCLYEKVTDEELARWKTIDIPYNKLYRFFDFDEEGIPCPIENEYGMGSCRDIVSKEYFCKYMMGYHWRTDTRNYKIYSNGNQSYYNYFDESNDYVKLELDISNDSTITITKWQSMSDKTLESYYFVYAPSDEQAGCNDLLCYDEQGQKKLTLRITGSGPDAFQCIVPLGNTYVACTFNRDPEMSVEELEEYFKEIGKI